MGAKINQYRVEARQEALHDLQKLAHDAGLEPEGYQRIALHGQPSTCILEQEEERDADLIIIGKHGKGMARSCCSAA